MSRLVGERRGEHLHPGDQDERLAPRGSGEVKALEIKRNSEPV